MNVMSPEVFKYSAKYEVHGRRENNLENDYKKKKTFLIMPFYIYTILFSYLFASLNFEFGY